MSRQVQPSRLAALTHRRFDLLIVGGGIIGAGIARDAALRGLTVALFEQSDFGSGTTAGSTRLIHGGLRYLEMFDFGLVRLDLRERETLLRIAPHLVRPLEFLVPLYRGRKGALQAVRDRWARWRLRIGMVLYDVLSFDKTLPRRRWLPRAAVTAHEPHLADPDPQGVPLQGAAAYYDAQVALPERLCLENILDARAHGALTFNHVEVLHALQDAAPSRVNSSPTPSPPERGPGGEARVTGLRVRDTLTGDLADIHGSIVVNASGPWFDRVASHLAPAPERRVRTTKGVHIACPPVVSRANVLESPIDGRLFFVIPWLGYTWIGTTDTDFVDDPAEARATAADVDYLMTSARHFFPALDPTQIVFTNAGVRALVMQQGSASSVSRQHEIRDEASGGSPGLISVLGGKITGYRAIAEEATDRVCRVLGARPGQPAPRACETAALPLPGAQQPSPPPTPTPADTDLVSPETLAHLRTLYGTRAAAVVGLVRDDRALAARLTPASRDGHPDIAAQVVFAVREEQCLRLADFLLRRTRLGFTADQGLSAAPQVAHLMAAELRWPPERTAHELDAYRALVARTQQFRQDPIPPKHHP